MEELKVGDTVQLKSGGPKMSVADTSGTRSPIGVTAGGGILCQWFAGNKLEHGFFKTETLKKVSEDDKAGR